MKGAKMFDLENLNPAVKFTHTDGWSVWLRMLSGNEFKKIRELVVNPQRELKEGSIYQWEDRNTDLENEMTWEYCISNWEIPGPDDTMIECTKENKIKLMLGSADFAVFVGQCLKDLADQTIANQKAKEKN